MCATAIVMPHFCTLLSCREHYVFGKIEVGYSWDQSAELTYACAFQQIASLETELATLSAKVKKMDTAEL